MPLNLFAPPTTNWLEDRNRGQAGIAARYANARRDMRMDALGAARASAGIGSGNATRRAALQALAPESARLVGAAREAAHAEEMDRARRQFEERERGRTWLNDLVGGIAGIGSQMMVPLISGLGSGGAPAGGPPAVPAPTGVSAPTAPAAASSGLMAAGRNPATPAHIGTMPRDPATAASMPGATPVPGTPEYEEWMRRMRGGAGGGFGSLLGAAAPVAGLFNPAAGAALGGAGRLFG